MTPHRNGPARRRSGTTAARGRSPRIGRLHRLGQAGGLAAAAAGTLAAAAPGSAATRTTSHPPPHVAAAAGACGRGAPEVRAACPARPRQARCYALYAPQATVNTAIAAQAAGRPLAPG